MVDPNGFSETFSALMRKAAQQRKTALLRASRENLLECGRILASTRLLCQEIEGLGGLPHVLTGHAKQIRERIDALIKEHL